MLKSKLPIYLFPFMLLLIVLPFPGTVAARLIFLVASFAVALFIGFRQPETFRGFPPARWSIAVWVAVCLLSLFYSIDLQYSLQEFKNELVYSLMVLYSFFIIGQQRPNVQNLIRALAAGFVIIGCVAVYNWMRNNYVWPEAGIQGGMGAYATYLVTCMPALFWLSVEDSDERWRWAARGLMLFGVFLGFLTLQRAIWPSLVAELFVAISFAKSRTGLNLRRRALFGIIAAVLIVSTLAVSESSKLRGLGGLADLLPSHGTFNVAIEDQTGKDGDARLPFWPLIFEKISEHPLSGPGFGQAMMKKAYPELVPPNFAHLWHTHNVVLNYAIQMGIPGAIALLVMFFGLARHFWQHIKTNPAVATAAIAGIMVIIGVLVRNQTNDFFRRDMALLFWALIGLFSAMCRPARATNAH